MIRLILFIGLILFSGCSKATLTEELLIKSSKYKDSGNLKKQAETFEDMIKVIESDSHSNSINMMYNHGFSGMQFVYLRMGDLYLNLNQYDKALLYFQKAKKVILKKSFSTRVGIDTVNTKIAKIYINLGENKKALSLLKENRKFSVAPIFQLDTYFLLKNIYIQEKNLSKLKDIADKLISLKNNFSTQTAITCDIDIHLGEIYIYLKDYNKSENYYRLCLDISKRQNGKYYTMTPEQYRMYMVSGREYLDLVTPNFMLGVLYLKKKNYNQSNIFFNRAYNYLEKQNFISKTNYAQILFYRSTLELERKNYKLSLDLLKESIKSKEYFRGESTLVNEYWAMSDLCSILKNNKDTYKYMKKSYNVFLKNRYRDFTILNRDSKINYLKMKKEPIENLLDIVFQYQKELTSLKKLKLSQTTLTDWLNYKGSISDAENMLRTIENQTTDKEVKNKIKQLKSEQQKLAVFMQNSKSKEQIEQQEQFIDKLFKSLAKKVNKFQEENSLQSIDYKDISKYLKADELYIDYARAGDDYYLFSLDHQNSISFVKLDRQFLPLIQGFRDEMKNIVDNNLANYKMNYNSKERLSKLYKLLLEPIKEKLASKNSLVVSTDGALRLLPFETLYNQENQHYLIEDKNIRYIPSGKEFVRLYKYTKHETTQSSKIVLFFNPDFGESNSSNPNLVRSVPKFYKHLPLDSLEGTKEEAKVIKKLFGNNVELFDKEWVSEENLLRVKEPKILHIATHGFFNNDKNIKNPMLKSGLVLSGVIKSRKKGKTNGFVTALNLSALDLKGTEVVVLSACDTGMVDIDATDSISGLGKAFIQAGAKDVVMSLWSVEDTMTKNLMVSFYQNIKNGLGYSHAMKEAKLKMIKEGLHPFYWGAFVVNGL